MRSNKIKKIKPKKVIKNLEKFLFLSFKTHQKLCFLEQELNLFPLIYKMA